MTEKELMKAIQSVGFAKLETELYLDTHPDNTAALDYFHEMHEKLRELTDAYEAEYGPLTTNGVHGDTWTWVHTPWPWQSEADAESERW